MQAPTCARTLRPHAIPCHQVTNFDVHDAAVRIVDEAQGDDKPEVEDAEAVVSSVLGAWKRRVGGKARTPRSASSIDDDEAPEDTGLWNDAHRILAEAFASQGSAGIQRICAVAGIDMLMASKKDMSSNTTADFRWRP